MEDFTTKEQVEERLGDIICSIEEMKENESRYKEVLDNGVFSSEEARSILEKSYEDYKDSAISDIESKVDEIIESLEELDRTENILHMGEKLKHEYISFLEDIKNNLDNVEYSLKLSLSFEEIDYTLKNEKINKIKQAMKLKKLNKEKSQYLSISELKEKNLSIREISEKLAISESTIKRRLKQFKESN